MLSHGEQNKAELLTAKRVFALNEGPQFTIERVCSVENCDHIIEYLSGWHHSRF